jgi:regulator of RNase E activity RraA
MGHSLTRADLEALRRFDTPTLANAIETFALRPFTAGYMSPAIRSIFPDLPRIVGYAVTAKITASTPYAADGPSNDALYAHVRACPAPRIVVVQDLDAPNCCGCLWGEVNSSIFAALDCEGVVTNGIVRDLPEVKAIGFRFFASDVGVSHAYVRICEVGCDVQVGGLTVRPGDLLHADMHGVLTIPAEIAAQLPAAADAIVAREQRLLAWVRSPAFDPERITEQRVSH